MAMQSSAGHGSLRVWEDPLADWVEAGDRRLVEQLMAEADLDRSRPIGEVLREFIDQQTEFVTDDYNYYGEARWYYELSCDDRNHGELVEHLHHILQSSFCNWEDPLADWVEAGDRHLVEQLMAAADLDRSRPIEEVLREFIDQQTEFVTHDYTYQGEASWYYELS